ncbi:peptidoglycan-binding protein [Rhizobium sp. L1K21]|uniref:peptidoglycan-binding protein n=1 Tax=Rhizobium sp. L1K21 TaxID=2954933 RepID=UPI0020933696|nr:peptidoglycan-binding protein [Rhizobium sp. L1K21]MCO6187167.1 peptidoglycan-binding protein [Rhizobium sp. L1K21]
MNGSNRNPPRQGERQSLDALNRTIEGLEARIEGLMGAGSSEQRGKSGHGYDEQVSGILQRQRAIEKTPSNFAGYTAQPSNGSRSLADAVRARFNQPGQPAQPARQSKPAPQYAPQRVATPSTHDTGDIARALLGLREELKRDINDGMSREMAALRAEIRDIRSHSAGDDYSAGLRDDMERLAASIDAISHQASPSDAATLRGEFDALRNMIDGLARQDSVRNVEEKLSRFNPEGLEDEILSLAGRIEDIKSQLGGMNSAPAIQALENKLYSIAEAVEAFGKHLPPDQTAFTNQFSDIDQRLEEIAHAISANAHNQKQNASSDHLKMLEQRIGDLGQQIDDWMSPRKQDSMMQRLEALSAKIEDMTTARTAARLEEQLDQLSSIVERAQSASAQPDLTQVLSEIFHKIDALEAGTVNNDLAERLDMLAQRIEEIEIQPVQQVNDEALFNRLESRLNDIAAHLNETVAQPASDTVSLQNLEAQIANLSSLLSSPPQQAGPEYGQLEGRMNALEDYMAANDEYIVEAARQAAEAVAEAYAQRGSAPAGGDADGIAQISALANDLRTLEDLTRSSEERNQRTFEALHDTLVQIAERIDQIGTVSEAQRAQPAPVQMAEAAAAPAKQASVQASAASAPEPAMPRAAQLRVDEEYLPESEDDILMDVPDLDDFSDTVSTSEQDEKKEKKSLFAELGRKLKPGQNNATAKKGRDIIEPTPPLDASESMSPELANQLLEPGSGAPDIQKILEKVRATHDLDGPDDNEKADYIAAARRAAKAAAEQLENEQKQNSVLKPKKLAKKQKDSAKAASEPSKVRRPIMLAAGAALLAIMSYQLVGPLLGGGSSEQVAVESDASPVDGTTAPLAEDAVAADAQAASEVQAAETPADTGQAVDNALATPAVADDSDSDVSPVETIRAAPQTSAASATDAIAETAALAPLDIPATVGPASLVDAAKANDPLALYEVGSRYTEGRGVEANMATAMTMFERAAELGFAPAEYRLGNMYEKGAGVAKDLTKARDYYQSAADKGNVSAMHNLAVVYAMGVDGQPDYEQAAKWFTDAADHGVKDSQFNLAILYAKGSGVQQDLGQSYKWFDIAAQTGDADAAQKRDEIAKVLTPDQLKAAKKAAAEWSPLPADQAANEITLPDEWAGEKTSTGSVDMKRAVRNIQAILNNNGFDAGTPDGIMGAKTVSAIKAFQTSIGQEPTGEINQALVRELLARNK